VSRSLPSTASHVCSATAARRRARTSYTLTSTGRTWPRNGNGVGHRAGHGGAHQVACAGSQGTYSEVRSRINLEAALPMLHLNGGKIADPTVRDRFPVDEVDALPRGCWHTPRVVSVDNPAETHQALVATLELCPGGIRDVPGGAHPGGVTEPASACAWWATIVLRSPHGDRPERVTDRVPRLSVVPAHAHKLMAQAPRPRARRGPAKGARVAVAARGAPGSGDTGAETEVSEG
jgi:hypothetical protein